MNALTRINRITRATSGITAKCLQTLLSKMA